nr:M14 family zinc carboxypeptidase [Lysinibacillus timonensis]
MNKGNIFTWIFAYLIMIISIDEVSAYESTSKTLSLEEFVPNENFIMESYLKGGNNLQINLISKTDSLMMGKGAQIIGIIPKGKEVTLKTIIGNLGIIDFKGMRGIIKLSDFVHKNLVNPKKNIGYTEMENLIILFSNLYPQFTELVRFGTSVEGRTLYALKVGNGKKEILIDASVHAREHITTNVLLEMIDLYTMAYAENSKFDGYNVKAILDNVSIWFVPMMNPDGVTLVQSKSNFSLGTLILNDGSTNFNRWKANIRGTDLNRNFDGGWTTKDSSLSPAYKDYKGEKPFSEPESTALRDYISKRNIKSYISYHSSGAVLYYYHHQKGDDLKRDLALVHKLSKVTGYSIMAPTGESGSGASADWFIMTYQLPGITVEIGPPVEESVVPLKYWDSIWKENKKVGLVAAIEAASRVDNLN